MLAINHPRAHSRTDIIPNLAGQPLHRPARLHYPHDITDYRSGCNMAFYFLPGSSNFCIILLVAIAAVYLARALPQGPPVDRHFDNVCNLMTPLHAGNVARPGNGGFSLETDLARNGYVGFNYTAGTTYTGDPQNPVCLPTREFVVIIIFNMCGCTCTNGCVVDSGLSPTVSL